MFTEVYIDTRDVFLQSPEELFTFPNTRSKKKTVWKGSSQPCGGLGRERWEREFFIDLLGCSVGKLFEV